VQLQNTIINFINGVLVPFDTKAKCKLKLLKYALFKLPCIHWYVWSSAHIKGFAW